MAQVAYFNVQLAELLIRGYLSALSRPENIVYFFRTIKQIERPDNRYVYALSDYGRKAAAILVIVRNRILRPIAGSLFERPPKSALKPNSTLQAQYRRTTKSFNDLIALLKAA